MARGARVAAALLPHVNLLLTVIAGAGLATAARLKWDPSTYIVVRELLPLEYRVLAALLLAGPLALLALAHLASLALGLRGATARRALLLMYATCMVSMVVGQLAAGWWAWGRVSEWLRSAQARQLREMLALRDDLRQLLAVLVRWHAVPDGLHRLIDEASDDLPRNAYCAGALALACVALQLTGAALAAAAATSQRPRKCRSNADTDSQRSLLYSSSSDHPSVKTIYKNGRLQIV